MKKRVAVVLPYFGAGGAETMVAHLVSHLDRNRIDVQVFCIYGEPQGNSLEQEVINSGVTINYVRKGLGFSLRAVKRLYSMLNSYHPDIVHTHLRACMYVAPWVVTHKCKMIHTLHSIPEYECASLLKKYVTLLLYKSKKAVPVAISEENRATISKFYKLPRNAIEMIPNPVVVSRYFHRGEGTKQVSFITVGRLSPEKNQQMLIKAFLRLAQTIKEIQLLVVGSGADMAELQALVEQEGAANKVKFIGHVTDVENYLAISDIFLLSSKVEGLPLAVLEAMAAGLPIISTNVGGIKDIVSDNGILVSPDDENGFLEAMKELCADEKRRKRMGLRSVEIAQRYDAPIIANMYTDLYLKY